MGNRIDCRKDSSSSVDKLHIVPEAFMRNDTALPVGTECDECNRHASKLEQAFIHHNRIWVPIMALQVPGKKGKSGANLDSSKLVKKKAKQRSP
jgi:hypothetical protein